MNTDIANLQNIFKIGNFLGITPKWNEKSSPGTKLHALSLSILVFIGTIISVLKRYSALSYFDMNSVQVFLEIVECVLELTFMVSCFMNVIWKGKHWKRFYCNITRAEELMHSLGFISNSKKGFYIVRICLFHITFILMHTFEILVWSNMEEISIEYGYILYRIIMYYQFFTIYVTVCITEMLRIRYNHLNKTLGDILRRNNKIIIPETDNRHICQKLYNIKKVYTVLYVIIYQINTIFGWVLFLNIATYALIILGNINYILKYTQTEDGGFNMRIFITYVLYSTVFTVSTILIVMFCDGVENSGKNIYKTIFLYQDIKEKPWLKRELEIFAKITRELAPKISTGFFKINQSLLSTLFSAIVTYLIIIIQFSITL